jgi:predicted aconitase with swiveling domain
VIEMRINGKPVVEGKASGEILFSPEPITFFGGVDPSSGKIVERGHPLYSQIIAGKILVFPHSKGSTVGSYILLRLARKGLAPAGIVSLRPDEVTIVGAIIGKIPMMTYVDINGNALPLNGKRGFLEVSSSGAYLDVF